MELLEYVFFNKYIERQKVRIIFGLGIIGIGLLILLTDYHFAVSCIFFFLGGVLSFFSLLSLIFYKDDFKKLDDDIVNEIIDKLENDNYSYYKNVGVLAFDDYFIDLYNRIELIEYNDLLWIYLFDDKYFPKVSPRYVRHKPYIGVNLKNGFFRSIFFPKSSLNYEEANEFIEFVVSKNKNVVVGYEKETRDMMNKKIRDIRNG